MGRHPQQLGMQQPVVVLVDDYPNHPPLVTASDGNRAVVAPPAHDGCSLLAAAQRQADPVAVELERRRRAAAGDIAIITPYAAQVRFLREELPVEIDSVDGFQGREKEAVVMSLVRSNPKAEIGFLRDVRRMNVAMTRARRKLLVVGDSATVSGHPFYRRMVEYFEGLGAYRTVWEEESAV